MGGGVLLAMRPAVSYLLYQAILMARKDPLYRVYLRELQSKQTKNANRVFSWMQWSDAKRWFNSAADSEGVYYILRPEHRNLPPSEIYNQIKQSYKC